MIVAANHAFHFVLHNDDALPSHSVHLVSVGGQDGALVLVPIKPVVLGEVVISVSARSTVAADAVTRKVLVKVCVLGEDGGGWGGGGGGVWGVWGEPNQTVALCLHSLRDWSRASPPPCSLRSSRTSPPSPKMCSSFSHQMLWRGARE